MSAFTQDQADAIAIQCEATYHKPNQFWILTNSELLNVCNAAAGEVRVEQPTITSRIEAERKAAEHEYSTTAFDYPSNPVGSRDWTLYWAGWLARSTSELKEKP